MKRLRLYDVRHSRFPGVLGLCTDDVQGIAERVNTAQQRLLYAKEAGDAGWWGTWAEMAFNVSRSSPYLTLPREVARLEMVDVCKHPVPIHNQFYEYLSFGNGRMPQSANWRHCRDLLPNTYTRNNVATFKDLASAPQLISVYATDSRDNIKRILISGLDPDGLEVYTDDFTNRVSGEFLTLKSPVDGPAMTVTLFSAITGIQKDATYGAVRIYQHDPNTGEEVLLLTMHPDEETAHYRRYYFHNLPNDCCDSLTDTTQVTALVKLEPIPVRVDTDYLLIQNLEALIEEAQSLRYSEMDSESAKMMAAERHRQAIGLLQGELNHYLGKGSLAIQFAPFGSARLAKQRIGMMR